MSDPDCLDYVSFGLVSTVLIAADRLHWETFFATYCKGRSYAAGNFILQGVSNEQLSTHSCLSL